MVNSDRKRTPRSVILYATRIAFFPLPWSHKAVRVATREKIRFFALTAIKSETTTLQIELAVERDVIQQSYLNELPCPNIMRTFSKRPNDLANVSF